MQDADSCLAPRADWVIFPCDSLNGGKVRVHAACSKLLSRAESKLCAHTYARPPADGSELQRSQLYAPVLLRPSLCTAELTVH